ncbi:MAG: hypothetical protein WAK12_08205 [Acidimicrobiales bacterium]
MRGFTRANSSRRRDLLFLILFGVAFGFVEAAVVFYLRNLIHFRENYSIPHYKVLLNLGFLTFVSPAHSLLLNHRVSDVEVARETSTIVMLVCVSFLAAKRTKQRVGAFLVSFACWDLAYYLFLRIIDDWPKSLFTRDVFFLIPVTWIGPVITPIVICIVMLALGVKLFVSD